MMFSECVTLPQNISFFSFHSYLFRMVCQKILRIEDTHSCVYYSLTLGFSTSFRGFPGTSLYNGSLFGDLQLFPPTYISHPVSNTRQRLCL